MAIPVVETFTKNFGLSVGLDSNKPSGVATGDLLVLIGCNDNPSDTVQFTDNKTGWNFAGGEGDTSSDAHIGVFWRIADGTEGAAETITATTERIWVMFYIRISGAASSPIHKSAFEVWCCPDEHWMPSVTTTIDDCLILYGLSFDGGDGYPFSVSGTGWVQKDQEQFNTTDTTSSGTWGVRDMATQGATGTAFVQCSVSDGGAFFQIALEPGAADTNISATTAALVLAGQAATITLDIDVGVSTAALVLAGQQANIDLGVNVLANTAALTLAEQAATITFDVEVNASLDALTLATYQAVISIGTTIFATTDALTLIEYPATIVYDVDVLASVDALVLAEFAVTISYGTNVNTNVDALTLATFPTFISMDVNVDTNVDLLALVAYAASITLDVGAVTAFPIPILRRRRR